MAKNKPTNQHFIPQCYLREFVDLNTPPEQEPYVWVFEKGKRKGRKKAPSNLFTETDLYTLSLKSGEKNYVIEETLSKLEGKYAEIFRSKIKSHLPLNEEEHIFLCAFVSVMLQRTLRHRDNLEHFFDELISHAETIEQQHNLELKETERLKKFKQDVHKVGVIRTLSDITELLTKMSVAFLCAPKGIKFLTSDDPCNLFNPDLQWQRFNSPGLAQKNIQVTLPLSPEILLCMSWSNLRGYVNWDKNWSDEINRLIAGQCYKYFISSAPQIKWRWLRRYPLDVFFVLKIVKHQFGILLYRVKSWHKYRRYVRKG
jgi:Protein of unknown function (DUF4238)